MTVLIFDLDDTLRVEKASADAVFSETREWAEQRHDLDPAALNAAIAQTCNELWLNAPAHDYCRDLGISAEEAMWGSFVCEDDQLRAMEPWAPTFRRDAWHLALQRVGVDDPSLAQELAATFADRRRTRHVVYPDTRSTLEILARDHRLAMLTNGAPAIQQCKIDGSGLRDFFDPIVISGEVGIGKPDPRIFEITLEHLGAAPDHAVMIGNSLHSDIGGANAAGIKAIWFNRDRIEHTGSPTPDRVITTLSELPAAL